MRSGREGERTKKEWNWEWNSNIYEIEKLMVGLSEIVLRRSGRKATRE